MIQLTLYSLLGKSELEVLCVLTRMVVVHVLEMCRKHLELVLTSWCWVECLLGMMSREVRRWRRMERGSSSSMAWHQKRQWASTLVVICRSIGNFTSFRDDFTSYVITMSSVFWWILQCVLLLLWCRSILLSVRVAIDWWSCDAANWFSAANPRLITHILLYTTKVH